MSDNMPVSIKTDDQAATRTVEDPQTQQTQPRSQLDGTLLQALLTRHELMQKQVKLQVLHLKQQNSMIQQQEHILRLDSQVLSSLQKGCIEQQNVISQYNECLDSFCKSMISPEFPDQADLPDLRKEPFQATGNDFNDNEVQEGEIKKRKYVQPSQQSSKKQCGESESEAALEQAQAGEGAAGESRDAHVQEQADDYDIMFGEEEKETEEERLKSCLLEYVQNRQASKNDQRQVGTKTLITLITL